jgi:D-serine deaminase-like pyridoxal phosphate-dependent protein
MKFSTQITRSARRRLRKTLPVLLLCGVAYAKDPIPTTNLQAAQQAIANAERVDAATFAGVDLGEARAKMSAAQQAVSEKEMEVAARLADESRAAAELAAARTSAAKANAVNADIKRSTATLVEEMQRKTGDNK